MKHLLYFSCFLCSLLIVLNLHAQSVTFTNETSLLTPNNGSYRCIVDMNGDFLDDVVRIGQGTDTIYIDYQQPNGTYQLRKVYIELNNYPSWSICAADMDGNGYNDLLFGGGQNVSFILANTDGTNYTEQFHPEFIFSQRSTFADIDNDGDIDAFVCHDVDQSHPYRNDGNGNMTLDQTLIETIDAPGNYAAQWVDYDNDQDIDLYITKCKGSAPPGDPDRTNAMYTNNGDGTFTENAAALGLDDNDQSWVTAFEDFDNDGDMDAFIVNHEQANKLMINDGNGNFIDQITGSGIPANALGAWHNQTADLNNDGYIDILANLNNTVYLNNGDLTFTEQIGPNANAALGDLNNDGYIDIYNGPNDVYINDGGSNHWFKLNLIGVQSNINGIGARVELTADGMTQIRDVRAGTDFSPMSSLACHFGVGQADDLEHVVVKWPSGTIDSIFSATINNSFTLTEGDGESSVGITETLSEQLNIFYNSNNSSVTVSSFEMFRNWEYAITSINGQVYHAGILERPNVEVSTELAQGVYLLSLHLDRKKVAKKFIIR